MEFLAYDEFLGQIIEELGPDALIDDEKFRVINTSSMVDRLLSTIVQPYLDN